MSQEYLIQRVKSAVSDLKKRYPLGRIALFGSVTRTDFNEQSDIDLVVEFNSDDFLLFNELSEEFEKMLGKKVDMLTFRSLKPRQLEYLKDKLLYV